MLLGGRLTAQEFWQIQDRWIGGWYKEDVLNRKSVCLLSDDENTKLSCFIIVFDSWTTGDFQTPKISSNVQMYYLRFNLWFMGYFN